MLAKKTHPDGLARAQALGVESEVRGKAACFSIACTAIWNGTMTYGYISRIM
jgi:hypothetical protein